MKTSESEFDPARERLFSFCYAGALVLAFLGTALFCLLQFTDLGRRLNHGTIELKTGQRYDIRMEFFEAGGTAVARLTWNGPGGAQGVVPTSRLFPR